MPTSARSARFVCRLTCLAIAAAVAALATPLTQAQTTTLDAALSGTPWNNSATLATGTGLALNLGLRFEYLIVGGGGGGGGFLGGGGGAGGLLTNVGGTGLPRAPGNYGVTVGTGGAGGLGSSNTRGANGGNSAIFGLSATGGGGGGAYFGNQPTRRIVARAAAPAAEARPTITSLQPLRVALARADKETTAAADTTRAAPIDGAGVAAVALGLPELRAAARPLDSVAAGPRRRSRV